MPTLGQVFEALNQLKAEGVLRDYALGGATAALFYAEPTRTYDVDVFVLLPPPTGSILEPLKAIYAWARSREFVIDAEHIFMHGVPVQFLPAHNALAEDAVVTARTLEYEGVDVRVIGPERFQAGETMRSKGPAAIPPASVESKARWHHAQVSRPLREKVRILLELQKEELPLLRRQRPLRAWEKPWPIEP